MSSQKVGREQMMETEYLACPNCGTELFMVEVSGQRLVIRVNTLFCPILVEEDQEGINIDPALLRCGACSWRGSVGELVPSHG